MIPPLRLIRGAIGRFSVGGRVLDDESDPPLEELERAASAGPAGAVALCCIAVAIVMGIWVSFYLLAFLPRGLLQ